jgi:hypothetical protein
VAALAPRTSLTSFTVSWSGTSTSGAPIASFTISVSIDSGAFTPWLTSTSLTSSTYTATIGHTYGFISQAYDAAGNVEPAHTTADTTITTTATPWQNPGNPLDVLGTGGAIVPEDALAVIDYLNTHTAAADVLPPTFSAGSYYYDVDGSGTVIPDDALKIIDYLNNHAAPAVTPTVSPAVSPAVTPVVANAVGTGSNASSEASSGGSPGVVAAAPSVVNVETGSPLPAQSESPTVSAAVVAAGQNVGSRGSAFTGNPSASSWLGPSSSASSLSSGATADETAGMLFRQITPTAVKSSTASAGLRAASAGWATAVDEVLSEPLSDWQDE